MAISPKDKYPGQLDLSDASGYPYGKAKNKAFEGDPTGTPLERDLVNDILGFQQALLVDAGITPSGTPESATASQYLQAVKASVGSGVVLRNWKSHLALSFSSINWGLANCYDRVSRRWFTFGNSIPGDPEVAYSCSGERFQYLTSADGGAGGSHDIQPRSSWANNAGTILLGGLPNSTTDRKLRVSTDGGATWNYRVLGSNDAQVVKPITYSEALGLWFASVGGNAGDGLFSSPDTTTWTLRTGAGGAPLFITVCDAPSPIVIGTLSQAAGATTGYFRSTNGTSWTTETFPVNLGGSKQPTYNPVHGKFFVPASAGIYSSETGLTGSWSLVTAVSAFPLASFGRVLIRGDGRVSLDAGVTWFEVLELPASPVIARIVAGEDRGVSMGTDAPQGDIYMSAQIGL